MRTVRDQWVALPTAWIEADGLKRFKWTKNGGRKTAALMVLMVVAHHADRDEGVARLTYDAMVAATGLSRATISVALKLLEKRGLIERPDDRGRSAIALVDFDRTVRGWGKLPVKGLYSGSAFAPFAHFTLRSITELDALKIYLLFVARRNNATNQVNLTYDGIEERSGVSRERIRAALSLLAGAALVHIDHVKSTTSEHGMANAYRLTHVDPHRHLGTTGRSTEASDFTDLLAGA